MALNLVPVVALAGAALAALLALLAPAAGTFAAQDGFSGRFADCSACHTRPMPGVPAAAAYLTGLPSAYEPGSTHLLSFGVDGGPPALPAPAPQGGFELEAERGSFEVPAEMQGLLRRPAARTVVYEPEGTLRRDWSVVWTAPGLEEEPRPVRFWLAVVAANGDHVVALNRSDAGEKFDSPATLQAVVPPSPAARAAWQALPLQPVVLTRVDAGATSIVEGTVADANATILSHRVDGGEWRERPAAPRFRLRFTDVPPGLHVVEIVAAGANRTSEPVAVTLAVPDARGHVPARDAGGTLLPSLLAALCLGGAAASRRNPR